MTFGRVNPQFRLEDQGIDGLGNVYYNLMEPALIEAALKRDEGTLGNGGAFLVSTGKFTGRSPKDKHVVKTDSVADSIWWENNAAMSPEGFDNLYADMVEHMKGGDYFEVSGQKIWTSYADKADWIFCLVRTEPDAPKHKGISFLLFDMASEGVTTKPIKLISGASPFCETFFDGVKVPKDQIVSERGKGWTVAKYLLTHEREMIGSSDAALFGSEDLVEVARDAIGLNENNQLDDPVLRGKIADFLIDELAFDAELARAKDWMRAGNQLGVESATLKYTGTELNKRRQELIMEAGGLEALEWDFANAESDEKASLWLRSKGNSIEGGTSEVMLSILSKAVLELG